MNSASLFLSHSNWSASQYWILIQSEGTRKQNRLKKHPNSVERINKKSKRLSKSMDCFGELRVKTRVALTDVRLEFGWRRRSERNFPQG